MSRKKKRAASKLYCLIDLEGATVSHSQIVVVGVANANYLQS